MTKAIVKFLLEFKKCLFKWLFGFKQDSKVCLFKISFPLIRINN